MLGHLIAVVVLLLFSSWALQFSFEEPPVPLVWPAAAVALAAAYRVGLTAAWTVAVALAVMYTLRDAAPITAVLLAAGTGAGGWLGARLLRRWRFDASFGRVRDVGMLLLVSAGVAAVLSALGATLPMTGLKADLGMAETFGLCWVADTMGLLLITPLLLSARWPSRIDFETIGWLVGVPAAVYGIYAGGLPEMFALPASYAVFPLVMIVALRRSIPVVALMLVTVAFIAITCTAMEKGPFVQADMRPNMLALHAHLAMLVLTGLLLAASRAEHVAAETRAREHLRMLARAGRISALSTMAAGIAHEINQPLCAVQSYAQSAQRLVKRGVETAELDSVLERIVHSTDKAAAIVRRMRGFLRGEPATRDQHDINELVREAVELVGPECKRLRIDLELALADRPLPARVDAVELEQVVVNLVQNAIESMPDAQEDDSRRQVCVSTRYDGERLLLAVDDTGPGLPQGDTTGLFEPLSDGGNGSGLGLPIVRTIVEAHGGVIEAGHSSEGGAEFRIYLPAAYGVGGHE
ncbi:MAG: ATP-binding protein [Halofilum sp. (in: g-proteobacteria)]